MRLFWQRVWTRQRRSPKPARWFSGGSQYGRSGQYLQHLLCIMTHTNIEITVLYKKHFGQLVSLLLSRFPELSIESAEDVVQDAFADAAAIWLRQGSPR